MDPIPSQVEIIGIPNYVEAWSAARIPGFVAAVLKRWQREHGGLPQHFHMTLCPQVELNARGGLPERVRELTDPRLRCRHFTGCHKPYFVVLFAGEDAAEHQAEAQQLLAWSESYAVSVEPQRLKLEFIEATEDLDEEPEPARPGRTLRELLQSGELVHILE